MAEQSSPLARPAPHVTRPRFLGGEVVQALLEYARTNRSSFVAAATGLGERSRVDATARHSATLPMSGQLAEHIRDRMLAASGELFSTLGVPAFTPADLELQLVASGDGAFYRRHVDVATSSSPAPRRVLTMVYYFFETPKRFSGGALRVHSFSPQSAEFVDIEPECDLMVAFAAFAPHEVLPVRCPSAEFMHSRFSITGWLRRLP